MIVIYVKYLIFTKINLATIFWLKNALNERFEISDLNLCIYYFNMMIFKNWNLKQLILNQSIYVKQMLRDHEMWNCKLLIIFMNVSYHLIKIFDEYTVDKNLKRVRIFEHLFEYRNISLWLSQHCRKQRNRIRVAAGSRDVTTVTWCD
jgi:hypothetical protein